MRGRLYRAWPRSFRSSLLLGLQRLVATVARADDGGDIARRTGRDGTSSHVGRGVLPASAAVLIESTGGLRPPSRNAGLLHCQFATRSVHWAEPDRSFLTGSGHRERDGRSGGRVESESPLQRVPRLTPHGADATLRGGRVRPATTEQVAGAPSVPSAPKVLTSRTMRAAASCFRRAAGRTRAG